MQRVYGAESRTRTGTAYATAPSRQRVYQFHHFGNLSLRIGVDYLLIYGTSGTSPEVGLDGDPCV